MILPKLPNRKITRKAFVSRAAAWRAAGRAAANSLQRSTGNQYLAINLEHEPRAKGKIRVIGWTMTGATETFYFESATPQELYAMAHRIQ